MARLMTPIAYDPLLLGVAARTIRTVAFTSGACCILACPLPSLAATFLAAALVEALP